MQSQPGPESPRANPKDKDQGPEGHKGQNEGFRVYSRGKPLGLGYSLSVEKQAYAGCLALSSMGSMATAIGKSTMSGAQRQNHSQYPNSFYLLSRYVAAGQIQGANEAAIRADLELEAFREHHIRNITAMLFANQSLIEKYIDGTLDKNDDVPDAEWLEDGQTGDEQAPHLSQQQQNIVQELVTSVQAGMKQRAG